MTPIETALGLALTERRKALGLSQMALGERIGITYQQVHKYERGLNRMSAGRLVDICRALDADPADVLQAAVASTGAAPAARRSDAGPYVLARAATGLKPEVIAALATLARRLHTSPQEPV